MTNHEVQHLNNSVACCLNVYNTSLIQTMQDALVLTPVVCEELLNRCKKTFLRARIQEDMPAITSAQLLQIHSDSISSSSSSSDADTLTVAAVAAASQRVRDTAAALGIRLREDLAVSDERRRAMFTAEATDLITKEV
jgi:hypothetical protein